MGGDGFTLPFALNTTKFNGRPQADVTIETARKNFLDHLVIEIQRAAVQTNDPFFVYLMPIVYYRGDGHSLRIRFIEVRAVAMDPRPLGSSARSVAQAEIDFILTLERVGMKVRFNLDAIQTPEGMQNATIKLTQLQQAGINTIMHYAMKAINSASSNDALSTIVLQFTGTNLQNLKDLNSMRTRNLVGTLNKDTNGMKKIIATFDSIFAYYSSTGVQYVLMAPQTLAMLSCRPWVPNVPKVDVPQTLGSTGAIVGGGVAPTTNPNVRIIVAPTIPSGTSGALYQPMQHRVYASTYTFFQSPLVPLGEPPSPTAVAFYDTDAGTQVQLSAKDIMTADPMLTKASDAAAWDVQMPTNPGADPRQVIPSPGQGLAWTEPPQLASLWGANTRYPVMRKAFGNYAQSLSWTDLQAKQHTLLPANSSPWGVSIKALDAWKTSNLRRALDRGKYAAQWQVDAALPYPPAAAFVAANAAVPNFIGAAPPALAANATESYGIIREAWLALNPDHQFNCLQGARPSEFRHFFTAITYLELLSGIWDTVADKEAFATELSRYRAPHFLFLDPSIQDRALNRLASQPRARANAANWSALPNDVKDLCPIAGVTMKDFMTTVGGSFDSMVEYFKNLEWCPVNMALVKPVHMADAYRIVTATGRFGQCSVRLNGTFEGTDVATTQGTIETSMYVGACVTNRDKFGVLDNAHIVPVGPTGAGRLADGIAEVKNFTKNLTAMIQAAPGRAQSSTPTLLAVPCSDYANGSTKIEALFYNKLEHAAAAAATTSKNAKDTCTKNLSLYLAFAGFKCPSTIDTTGVGRCINMDSLVKSMDLASARAAHASAYCVTRSRDSATNKERHFVEPSTCSIIMGTREVETIAGNCVFGVIADEVTGFRTSGLIGSGGGERHPNVQEIYAL